MSERILVPVLGESVTEATVAKWLKNEGDRVNVEVPAPSSGTMIRYLLKKAKL